MEQIHRYIFSILGILIVIQACSCNKDNPSISSPVEYLQSNFTQLPEEQISISRDENTLASYTQPTERYSHGILGDKIEAGQLVISVDNIFHELTLEEKYVFEDIRPRLFDVDGDGELEFITIRSDLEEGAGIVIYKILVDQIVEYARVLEIGSANRWLNIVAIDDLDNDGVVEIAWIETPHIGGILKVAKIRPGFLEVLSEESLYSNHAIGSRNLCLSTLIETEGQKIIYIPNQNRDAIVGFTFNGEDLVLYETIPLSLDFSKPLNSQYEFMNEVIHEEDNCIFIE